MAVLRFFETSSTAATSKNLKFLEPKLVVNWLLYRSMHRGSHFKSIFAPVVSTIDCMMPFRKFEPEIVLQVP